MSGRNDPRLPARTVDYIQDLVGADVPRDLIKVAVVAQDLGELDVSAAEVDVDINSQSLPQVAADIEQIGGQAQSAVDVADKIDQIEDALASVGTDSLRVTSPNPLDVSGAEVDVGINSQTLGSLTVTDNGSLSLANYTGGNLPISLEAQNVTPLTVTDDGSLNIAGTVATEQQSPIQVEDSGGNNIDPAEATEHPNTQVSGEDIIANGDLVVGPVSVAKSEGVTIAANSTDGNTFSVSVEWTDGSGNIYQEESATDIQLSSVAQDFARLVRKGPQVTVTVTDESGATQNNINIHVDSQG